MSSLNMMPVTIKQFTNLIRESIEDENYEPILGLGKAGVGKTVSIHELTKELGIGYCELRLVTLTEIDMLGMPKINDNDRTTYASNDLLPHEGRDGKRGVLVLDEITSATSTIRAAAYQLLDSKRALGNYKLPDEWLVVALGNGPEDGGTFQGMESAFLNRCNALRIEPDLNSWKTWAINNGLHPTVVAFLSSMPDYLHKMDPDGEASVFPSPRTWEKLSKKLIAREAKNGGKPLDQESVDIYAASCIGQEVASTFGAFYAYSKQVVSVSDILEGKAKADIGVIESEVMYITVQNLVRTLRQELVLGKIGNGQYKDETVKRVANACNWIVKVGDKSLDLSVMALQDLAANVKEFAELIINDDKFDEYCPSLLEFAEKNSIIFG